MATAPAVANRRVFLRTSLVAGLAAAARVPGRSAAADPSATRATSRVAVTAGDDRAANTLAGLKPFREEIASRIGDRRVVIKPNNVAIDIQLAATHADCIEGILEFLKSIGKVGQAVIAESAAPGRPWRASPTSATRAWRPSTG